MSAHTARPGLRQVQPQRPGVSIGYSAVGSGLAACYPVTKVRK